MLIWAITAVSIVGTILNAKKIIACFYLWGLANMAWFAVDILNKQYGRAFLDAFQLCLGIYGLMEWRKDAENILK